MSFASRLVHWVSIVESSKGDAEDTDDLDEYGHAEDGPDVVTTIRALIQPRRAEEVAAISQAGVEVSDYIVYMESRALAGNAYLVDATAAGPVSGGRRFDVVGVRDFAFGRSPHLEVDVKLRGATEAPIGS